MILAGSIFLLLLPQDLLAQGAQSLIVDGDGNVYESILIGTQEWLVQDLRTTRYSDGQPIALMTESDHSWRRGNQAGYTWYKNDSAAQVAAAYGALYNWYAVQTAKLCPVGWHVATDEEWTILIDYLDPAEVDASAFGKIQSEVAGGKLKEVGTDHWHISNGDASNESGWTGLGGGVRINEGNSYHRKSMGLWWTSTKQREAFAYGRSLRTKNGGIGRFSDFMNHFMSVRCIKD